MGEVGDLRGGNAVLREHLLDPLQDPHRGVGRDGGDLADTQRAGTLVDHREIGKGAADVNADSVSHGPFRGPFRAVGGQSSCRVTSLRVF